MTPTGIDPRYLRRVKLKIETAGSADDHNAASCCFCLINLYHAILMTSDMKQRRTADES